MSTVMHETNCYLCDSSKREKLVSQEGHDPYLAVVDDTLHDVERNWYVCKDCGFVYRSPILSESDIDVLYEGYESDVFKDTNPDTFFDKIYNLPPEESENYQKSVWLLDVLKSNTSKPLEQLTTLDVGCGSGLLLKTMTDVLGLADTYGVELNKAYAELAHRRSDANQVIHGSFKPGMFNKKFQLLILTKVLEHVPAPKNFLKFLAQDIEQDGYLFLEVPDVIDFGNLPPSDPRFFIPHIYFFSANTLSALVCQIGFEVIKVRTIIPPRGRSYLQLLAQKNGGGNVTATIPYDNPNDIVKMVK